MYFNEYLNECLDLIVAEFFLLAGFEKLGEGGERYDLGLGCIHAGAIVHNACGCYGVENLLFV